MIINFKLFKNLNTWHRFAAVFLFISLFYTTEYLNFKTNIWSDTDYFLIELKPEVVSDIISSQPSFILFYDENTDVWHRMSYNLNQLAGQKGNKYTFFRLNPDKYPEHATDYNTSGTFFILILNKNKEIRHIMGNITEKKRKLFIVK